MEKFNFSPSALTMATSPFVSAATIGAWLFNTWNCPSTEGTRTDVMAPLKISLSGVRMAIFTLRNDE